MASSYCASHHPEGNRLGNLSYAGDITPEQAFHYLATHQAVLVDVRTPPEWQEGMPDLAQTSSELLAISWKILPDYTLNPDFIAQLEKAAIPKDTPIFFMCKGGGRSLDAAVAMTQFGYEHCYNIQGGFEGKQDAPGWRASQLPWQRG